MRIKGLRSTEDTLELNQMRFKYSSLATTLPAHSCNGISILVLTSIVKDIVSSNATRYGKSSPLTASGVITTISGGTSTIYVDDLYKIDVATELILGPNKDGDWEEVTVTGTVGDHEVQLNFFTLYDYEYGDSINFTKTFYLFNNYSVTGLALTMSNDAKGHFDFTPLPGKWAAIFFIPCTDVELQMTFFIVDP